MKRGDFGNLISRIKNDYAFRTFVFSTFSFLVTAVFTGYNVFLGIAYKALWNFGIAVYYALLLIVRSYVIFSEAKFFKSGLDGESKEYRRVKMLSVQSVALLIIDFALIAPVALMVMQQKPINYSIIPAISIAAYTTFKIVTSSINFAKTRKEKNLSVKMLRDVNFTDALVSVLSLQYTLIMTVDGGIKEDMFIMCACTSFIIWAFLIVVSVIGVVKAIKLRRNYRRT